MKVWVDVHSPSNVPMFASIAKRLRAWDFFFTSTDHAEVLDLLQEYAIPHECVWRWPSHKTWQRYLDAVVRVTSLFLSISAFDLSLSHGDFQSVIVSKARGIPAVAMIDNDSSLVLQERLITFRYASRILCPAAIRYSRLEQLGIEKEKVTHYPGYKEDIYIADYIPDPEFSKKVPFNDYVVVRPEASFAIYFRSEELLTRRIVKALLAKGMNVVYLPRSRQEKDLVTDLGVFIPQKPLKGLDLCWHSRAVLTGSGTLAREAALLGVPAVSFFPGNLLSVDRQLVKEGKIFHSRDLKSIIDFVESDNTKPRVLNRMKHERVASAVVDILRSVQESIRSCQK
jgi:predicted glycosyltransferase